MWHLKTRLGTFWVVPILNRENSYFLGVDDQELGIYSNAERAARDVKEQATGYLKWDIQARPKAPAHIVGWVEGEPEEWQRQ